MPREQRTNMVPYMKRLTQEQKAVLMAVVREKPEWKDRHLGMFPFMPHKDVVTWLANWIWLNPVAKKRIHARILEIIAIDKAAGTVLSLDDAKVRRRFGNHPERGVTIPGLRTYFEWRQRRPFERSERGLHFMPDGTWRYADQTLNAVEVRNQTVSLKRVGANRWLVNCREGASRFVYIWLKENVG